MASNYLIAGLGNPGILYSKTRHNIGFQVVKAFADKYEMSFKKNSKLQGYVANSVIDEKSIYLLMPSTYMNNSGIAVRLCKNFYKIDIPKILIVVDDVEIPFGEFRIKKDSGSGGHNGLKSIEENLKSKEYIRLRVGVGKEERKCLKSYVLNRFSKVEKKQLDEIINQAVDIIEIWIKDGLEKAANIANVRKKES